MSPSKKYADARKAYRVSLRHKLAKNYQQESDANVIMDRRWMNGFMAAGYHSGLIILKDLKLECLSAYKASFGTRMTSAQERQLERRLAKLCSME